jgi:hypothetical protein
MIQTIAQGAQSLHVFFVEALQLRLREHRVTLTVLNDGVGKKDDLLDEEFPFEVKVHKVSP